MKNSYICIYEYIYYIIKLFYFINYFHLINYFFDRDWGFMIFIIKLNNLF